MGLRRKGKIKFETKIDGEKVDLRLSHVNVKLPSISSKYKDKTFTLLLVYGFGKEPMYLLGSRICSNKNEVIQVLKDYLKRWRIEELFRVQKKEFNIESIQLMTLAGVQMMYSFVNMLIGLYSTIIENDNSLTFIALKSTRNTQSHTKIKFFFAGLSIVSQ